MASDGELFAEEEVSGFCIEAEESDVHGDLLGWGARQHQLIKRRLFFWILD